jgi:hypothetical protein
MFAGKQTPASFELLLLVKSDPPATASDKATGVNRQVASLGNVEPQDRLLAVTENS